MAENRLAVELYQFLSSHFVQDFGAWPLVFEIFKLSLTKEEARLLLLKLIIIHDLVKGYASRVGPESGR